jgi:hypothetical protein
MSDHNDIYSIIDRLRILESSITPDTVRHGLNAQQRSVPQLPALFKPKHISVLTAKTDPEHPMKGYAVGSSEGADLSALKALIEDSDDAVRSAITRRIVGQHLDLVSQHGVEAVLQAIDDVAENVGQVDEIGSSDVSAYVQMVQRELGDRPQDLDEAVTAEDKLAQIKKSFTDYLKSIEDEVRQDRELTKPAKDRELSKPAKNRDLITQEHGTNLPESAAVKTMAMEDGRMCEIHGNERDGFEIRHEGRCMPRKFDKLDHAVIALEMYLARRGRSKDMSADYLDEE